MNIRDIALTHCSHLSSLVPQQYKQGKFFKQESPALQDFFLSSSPYPSLPFPLLLSSFLFFCSLKNCVAFYLLNFIPRLMTTRLKAINVNTDKVSYSIPMLLLKKKISYWISFYLYLMYFVSCNLLSSIINTSNSIKWSIIHLSLVWDFMVPFLLH